MYPPIIAKPIKNLSELIGNILISQGIKNDRAFGNDALDVEDEINALTEVLLLRSLTPPVAVGLLGNWGSGKSFGMHLIQSQIKARRRQSVTSEEAWGKWNPRQEAQIERMSPSVGHVYQIQFNAWTYAKSNLWASLMQEIFYELNRQITLEQKLGRFLSEKDIPLIEKASPISPADRSQHYTPYKFLNYYILRHYRLIQSFYRSIKNKIYTIFLLICSLLDLAIGQLIVHLGLIFFTILFAILLIILYLITVFLQWRIEKTHFKSTDINWVNKLDSYIEGRPFIDWLERQLTAYYFPQLNHLPSASKFDYFLQVIERSLFFFFEGFPKRIRNRITYWQRQQGALEPTKTESHSQQTPLGIDENLQFGEIARVNQALRQGGNLWEVLYEINEADADALLEQRLSKEDRAKWSSLKSDQEISNVLWSTLDKIQRQKTQNFQALEQKLKEAEKTLERKQKSNEISINQKLNRRRIGALWTPFFNGIARLKFSKEDIEAFSAAGKSFQRFRDTIKSWQGLLALFCMGLLIALTVSSDSREVIIQLLQTILNSQTLRDLIPEWIKNRLNSLVSWLSEAIKEFPTWLQLGSATLISLLPIIKALTTYIGSVQKEQARIQGEKDTLIQQSQDRVASEAQAVAQLRLRVEEERLQLGPNAQYPSLLDFVNARISGDDYGKHLGLMQQIKQDLAALSSRLTLNQGNEEEIQQLFPRGPARVFLYIDDLDRCPPDRVVEVLEAVQLLLNTKLFVVILAIDDRYIARALEQVYAGVLKRRGKPSGIDYLEKIIQIPYRMRPISPDTVEKYFRSQLTIKEPNSDPEDQSRKAGNVYQAVHDPSTKPSSHSNSESGQPKSQSIQDTANLESEKLRLVIDEVDHLSSAEDETIAQNLTSSAKSPEESLPSPKPSEPYAKAAVNPSTEPTELPKASETEQKSNPSPAKRNEALSDQPPTPEEVTYISTIATVDAFDEEELKLLVDCCKYVDITPRTGKRLINIYKILQIIWKTRHKEKGHDLPDDPKKRIVMSFLALSGRYPDFMRSLFDEIDMRLEQATFASNNGKITENPSIELPLSDFLKKLGPKSNLSNYQDSHTKREWARFTSDIKHMVTDSTTQATDPVLNLDRRTFSLMLSFCFVGDLGYDPDDQPINFPSQQNPE